MVHYLAIGLVLLHTLFWGMGLALWITPKGWRRAWPLLVPVLGWALQSAVVWAGAMADLGGTAVYGRASLVLPLVLLVTGLRRRGWRRAGADWRRTAGVWGLVVATAGLLTWPYAAASRELTTLSLGSCDAADYAAGARLLHEFARGDRDGFVGQTEVVSVASVDNFFDYFVRLNHFTPSGLIAHHAGVLGWREHQLVGVVTVSFLALSLPMVFWLARVALRLRPGPAGVVAAVYGMSPVTWYAVAHVAMSQLLAAQAIALVTAVGLVVWRSGARWRALGRWLPVLLAAYWIVLGAYNFIVVVMFIPVAVAVAGGAIHQREWGRTVRWATIMAAPLAVAAGVFLPRAAGLVERFQLLMTNDFGWRIPGLTPEGWLGAVTSTSLTPVEGVWRWVLATVVGAGIVWGVGRRRGHRWVMMALAVPPLVGYAYLLARGVWRDTNASYDAYKLLSVFFPGLLAVSVAALGEGRRAWVGAALILAILGVNAVAAGRFVARLGEAPLRVTPALAALAEVELNPRVRSLNLRVPDMWSRLWANALLLRREQFFETHTYEGRLNTPLRGEWDLRSGFVRVFPSAEGGGVAQPPAPFWLAPAEPGSAVQVELGAGWFALEQNVRRGSQWRWTGEEAELVVENFSGRPLSARVELAARALDERNVEIWLGDRRVATGVVGVRPGQVRLDGVTLPTGRSTLRLRTDGPAISPPGDGRALGFCVYGVDVVLQEGVAAGVK